MANRPTIDWRSLTVQMVLIFTALVLLAAAAVRLPAIILIRNQVDKASHGDAVYSVSVVI